MGILIKIEQEQRINQKNAIIILLSHQIKLQQSFMHSLVDRQNNVLSLQLLQ